VDGRGDDLGVVGGRDRLHGGRRRTASDRADLHAGSQGLQLTVMSYTLTLASLILLADSLSDRWGRRRMFLAGVTYAIVVLPGGGVRSPGFAAAAVLALLSSATFAVTERRSPPG
jgi:MFS family permease